MFFIPSVGYAFPVNEMTESEISLILNSAVSALFQALGYNRNTSWALAFGPEENESIGLKKIIVEWDQ